MASDNWLKRWDTFKKEEAESILSYKNELLIAIYGAYKPPADETHLGEQERLIKLQDYLIEQGYVNTCLVDDLPTDNNSLSPNLDKSLKALEAADLNILVFTCRGNTDSVTMELSHAIENNLLYKCRVVEEVYNEITAIGTLPKERLNVYRYEVIKVECQNDEDLHEHVGGVVFAFLKECMKKHM